MAKLTYERAETRSETSLLNSVIRSLPFEWLMCRVYQHEFPHPRPDAHWEWDPARRMWFTPVECPSCTTKKHRAMDANGYNIPQVPYYYPEGYMHGEVNLITREGRAAMRREIQRRRNLRVPR